MFTEDEQKDILTKLGYEVKIYDVRNRLGGMNAMIHKHYGYEVFKDGKLIGKLEKVFKEELIKRIFNI